MTLLNIKNFIKKSGNMKSQCSLLFKFSLRFNLFFCKPSLI